MCIVIELSNCKLSILSSKETTFKRISVPRQIFTSDGKDLIRFNVQIFWEKNCQFYIINFHSAGFLGIIIFIFNQVFFQIVKRFWENM